jgi:hypothetical protein
VTAISLLLSATVKAAESTQDIEPPEIVLQIEAITAIEAGDEEKQTGQKDSPVWYENSARTYVMSFSDRGALGGSIKPKRPLPSKVSHLIDLSDDEFDGGSAHDCSTADYRCISALFGVFAIPRERLSPEIEYSVAGALLKVEDCLVGDESVCQVAIIRSDCHKWSHERCETVPGGRSKSDHPGAIFYFIYNEDVGITAYGSATQPAMTKDERLSVASQMILQGRKGLLSEDH